MTAHGPRGAALAALLASVGQGHFLDDALEPRVAPLEDDRDRALARELAYGACRHWVRLAAVRDHLLARPLKARDADVGVAMVLGLYQLEYSRIPHHAAVAESVRLADVLGKRWARGLLNAVLRRYLRERDDCLAAVDRDPAARHSHPAWLLEALATAWPQHWQDVVAANNARAPMTLRVNRRHLDREQALKELAAAGIDADPCRHSEDGLHLARARDVGRLPGFAEGRLSVQDEAAQLACALLAPGPGDRVLDACAAPGGKLAHLLERNPGLAAAVAVERDAARADRLRETLARLGLRAATVIADATQPQQWWNGTPFDRILLDAPCSATGVIRRHPDIKLHRRAADLENLAQQQLRLLSALWPLLARGGRLLYATCSVMPEENSAPVTRFLSAHDDAATLDLPQTWGIASPPGRQILPGEAGMDGFYYALLEKR